MEKIKTFLANWLVNYPVICFFTICARYQMYKIKKLSNKMGVFLKDKNISTERGIPMSYFDDEYYDIEENINYTEAVGKVPYNLIPIEKESVIYKDVESFTKFLEEDTQEKNSFKNHSLDFRKTLLKALENNNTRNK